MSDVPKERREELCEDCDRVDRIKGEFARLTTTELRALLDMANERDRYRALLEAYSSGAFGTHEWFMRQVLTELEGKNNG